MYAIKKGVDMNKRWFLLLALLGLFALAYGYPQIALAFFIFFAVSGIAFLIDRLDKRRIGERTVTIKISKTPPPN